MTRILVTGAAGFVGSHVAPALLEAGHDVVGLVRREDDAARVVDRLRPDQRAQVAVATGDVTDRGTLAPAMDGVETVVHLAAIPRDWDGGASLRLVNTEGTRNVVVAAQEAGVRRFVHLGAMGVADEPDLHYSSSKARAISIVRDSSLAWTVLSPSVLYGPRDGFFNILAGLVRYSPLITPLTGGGDARFQPLAIGDFARTVVASLADDGTVGREYALGGPRYWTYREMVEEVCRAMGARRLLVPVPVPLIRLVAGAAEAVRFPFPASTDQLRQLRLDNTGPLDGVRAGFGFDPQPMEGSLGYLRRRLADQ